VKQTCKWHEAAVPGHIESACGVWIEGTPLGVVFAEMIGAKCHICGKKLSWALGRLYPTEGG